MQVAQIPEVLNNYGYFLETRGRVASEKYESKRLTHTCRRSTTRSTQT